jgi:ABC-2 type transport system ATP-binding protein/lipopolysaccharide transport system ATP-binding protein
MISVQFRNVGVAYPSQRIPSLKEWLLRGGRARGEPVDALRDVTLSVAAGEAFGVIGGNGAGKSTLVRVAAGIIAPSTGEVTTRGVVAPIIELGTGFEGELSGRENIFFNGALLGRSRAFMKRVIDEIIDFADIGGEFIDAPLRTYSTGMVARIAFAIATTIEADLLLLDEVLAVGDVAFRERCYERIRQFHANGATILLVSHDMDAVANLCSRAVWLDHGCELGVGPAREVIDAYSRAAHVRVPEAV